MTRTQSEYHVKGRTAQDKAAHFAEYAKDHGWSGKWSTEEDGITHLFTRRGEDETIDIWWTENGSLMLDRLPIYSLAGERIKLRNVSAASIIVAGEPDSSRRQKAARRQRCKIDGANATAAIPADEIDDYITKMQGSLPFDHESSDDEIKVALLGRVISWVNRMSGQMDQALVSDNPKQFKVVRNGHDYVDFVYPIQRSNVFETYGFRSVYLDSIVAVG